MNLEDHSPEMMQHALKIAVENNAISMKYIQAILNNWKTNNIKTVEQATRPRKIKQSKRSAPMPKYSDTTDTKLSVEERNELMAKLNSLEE